MSMIKVIDPAGFNFDQPITSMVQLHRRGVDRSWLQKTAAVLTREMSELQPEEGKTFVHLIALGDMERYGQNRNGDAFPKAANEKYHDTFVKHANFYKHHRNKPYLGHTIYGNVKYSSYNPEMNRVELVVAIDNKKAPDTVEKIASGKDLSVSMACRVPVDFCTTCGHEAPSTDKYCDCLKKHATQILEDGRQVGMINKEPTFFDISEVVRNADRIAFSLRKVASAYVPVFSADLAASMGVTAPDAVQAARYNHLRQTLAKAAQIERELSCTVQLDSSSMRKVAEVLNASTGVDCRVTDEQLPGVFKRLQDARASLPIEDFFRLVMGEKYASVQEFLPSARATLPGIFTALEKNAEEILFSIDKYFPLDIPLPYGIKDVVDTVAVNGSLMAGPLQQRVMGETLLKAASAPGPVKRASVVDPRGWTLAKEYAKYKLAFLDNVEPSVMRLSVLQNLY